MNLGDCIKNKLNQLKPTVTTVYSSSGTVIKESKDTAGNVCITKLDVSSPGYVIDNTPDLSVSCILSWLYMGSQDVSHDHELLKLHGITHILSVGIQCPQYEDIQTTFVEAYDFGEFRIIDIFENCNHIIDSVRTSNGKIYVHCNAGVSRSTTVVAAYLIYYNKTNPVEALDMIKRVRPKVNPNEGFVRQLSEYASRLSHGIN